MANSLIIPTMLGMLFAVSVAYPRGQPNYDNIPQCLQPKAPGLCLAYFQAFYYNPSTRKCESFIYGGCQGNANRFSTLEECLDKCGDFEPETTEFKLIHESDEEQKDSKEKVIASEDNQNSDEEHPNGQQVDPCKLPVKMGPCRAMFPRFYFNGEKCESFIYGGCQANDNNFKTIEDCQRRCESNSEEKTAESEGATA